MECDAWPSVPTANSLPRPAMTHSIKLWDVDSGKELKTLQDMPAASGAWPSAPAAIAWRRRASDMTIKIWNAQRPRHPHLARPQHRRFEPGLQPRRRPSRFRQLGPVDENVGPRQGRGTLFIRRRSCQAVLSVAFSPDGKRLVSAGRARRREGVGCGHGPGALAHSGMRQGGQQRLLQQ